MNNAQNYSITLNNNAQDLFRRILNEKFLKNGLGTLDNLKLENIESGKLSVDNETIDLMYKLIVLDNLKTIMMLLQFYK